MTDSNHKEKEIRATPRELFILALLPVMMLLILILTGLLITQKAALQRADERCNRLIQDLADTHPSSRLSMKVHMNLTNFTIEGPP